MSRNSRKSSAHALVKAIVLVFLLAFSLKFYLQNDPGLIPTAVMGATLVAAILIIILLGYTDFQKYAFIPVILISLHEMYQRISTGTDVVDAFYFLAFILLSVYFMVRSQRKKNHSEKEK